MPAYLYRVPSGIPGTISRDAANATVEPQLQDAAHPFSAYGLPAVLDTNGVRPVTTGDAASAVYGILVRPYPSASAYGSEGFGPGAPLPGFTVDVLKRGYISVMVSGTAPTANGAVYVRVSNETGNTNPIGGFEAAADSTNTIQLTNAYFTGGMDSNGNSEIAYNL